MTKNPRKTTRAAPKPDEPARERDEAHEPERKPRPPISAAQLAAPSTRRWRRAGRSEPTS